MPRCHLTVQIKDFSFFLFASQICHRSLFSSASEYRVLLGMESGRNRPTPGPCSSWQVASSAQSPGWRLKGETRAGSHRGGRGDQSALPGAGLAALFTIELVVADTMLRNEVAPPEEIHTGWVL